MLIGFSEAERREFFREGKARVTFGYSSLEKSEVISHSDKKLRGGVISRNPRLVIYF